MHRLVNSVLSLWPLALVAGCAADDYAGGIFVRMAVAPASGCAVTAQPTEAGVSHGQLSSAFPSPYIVTAQMQSRISAAVGQETQRTVILTGANVDLTFPGSTLFTAADLADMKTTGITHFKSLFSAPLAPNEALTDASFELVAPALYDQIYAKAPEARMLNGPPFALEVLATFTVVGTMAGNEVNSQPFQFPIGIANTNHIVELLVPGTCPLPLGTMAKTGNGCGLAQDAPITCCTDMTSGQLVCPAPIATATP